MHKKSSCLHKQRPLTSLQAVYRALVSYGRADIATIRSSTGLIPRQIKKALSVLVQHNLVFWHTLSQGRPAFYEVNPAATYDLIRAGKYVQITEDRFGALAGEVVANLSSIGYSRIKDLFETCRTKSGTKSLENDVSKIQSASKSADSTYMEYSNEKHDNAPSAQELYRVLGDLLEFGVFSHVHESHLRSQADNDAELERIIPPVEAYKAQNKRKAVALRERKKKEKWLEWKFGTKAQRTEIQFLKNRLKRLWDDSEGQESRKRLKTGQSGDRRDFMPNGATAVHTNTDSKLTVRQYVCGLLRHLLISLQEDSIIRVNHEKLMCLMRNDFLVKTAEQRIGIATSKVYKCVLRLIEYNIKACKDELRLFDYDEYENELLVNDDDNLITSPRISTKIVTAAFNEASEFVNALGKMTDDSMKPTSEDHRKRHRRKTDSRSGTPEDHPASTNSQAPNSGFKSSNSDLSRINLKSNDDIMEIEDDSQSKATVSESIRQHLLLLSNHPDQFLHHFPETDTEPEKWTIDFSQTARAFARQTLFQNIAARFGTPSSRIARICHEKGRLDDKTLCTLCLLPQKELRARLLTMQRAGLLEQQEMPRDNARTASRTTFLYYFDERKCAANVLEDCNKTILRCLQRLCVEKDKIEGVLAKVNRSDVKGREDDLLGEREKQGLAKWRATEETIWGEIGRIDMVVSTLKDF